MYIRIKTPDFSS